MALSSDAKMAINFEHAWGDGVAVVRFLNEVCSTSASDVYTPQEGGAATGLSAQKLDFELDDSVKGSIKTCLLYTSPSPRDGLLSRMPSSA